MTDAILEWQTRKLQEIEQSRDQWTVYVRPQLVVEIAFNGVVQERLTELAKQRRLYGLPMGRSRD